MPLSITIPAFAFGAVLLLIALTGGGFKLFGAEIFHTIDRAGRIAAAILGVSFLALSIYLWTQIDRGPAPTPVVLPTPPPAGPHPEVKVTAEPLPLGIYSFGEEIRVILIDSETREPFKTQNVVWLHNHKKPVATGPVVQHTFTLPNTTMAYQLDVFYNSRDAYQYISKEFPVKEPDQPITVQPELPKGSSGGGVVTCGFDPVSAEEYYAVNQYLQANPGMSCGEALPIVMEQLAWRRATSIGR